MNETEMRVAVGTVIGWKGPFHGPNKLGQICCFHEGRLQVVPDFPNDANAALTFCDVLAGRGWGWVLEGIGKTRRCTFYKTLGTDISATAPTLALAICKAGLRCLNLWPDAATDGGDL